MKLKGLRALRYALLDMLTLIQWSRVVQIGADSV